MKARGSRTRTGALLSLPMSVLLLVFFFMPWLKLSCDPSGLVGTSMSSALANMPDPLPEAKVLASATGWEIARGQITPEDEFRDAKADMPKGQQLPKPRSWLYLGLALPAVLLIVAAMGILGNISPGRAGKVMLLLGLAGVGIMIATATVDYVGDVFDVAREEMSKASPGGPPLMFRTAMERSVAEAESAMKKALKTQATGYLWASLALYGVIAGCGLVTLNDPQEFFTHAQHAREASPFQQDTLTPGPEPQFHRPAPAEPALEQLPSFGPDITPLPRSESPAAAPVDDN